ncbi:Enamine deaminase RidA, house cleaning of reactive enamine intermediates, YjgF/YER057c/UK114 family [Paenibacillus sp. UNCCL117]|uniref:RidA family protein n=1 Tax=unclassified Paenibacillus TaxID=185978 RepID=UPI00088B98A7|nr:MULTISPECIES: RidA family protein [unclassified Paenibacillus]SDD63298.1 Enamine deaminase RidA, house cleaning of reactive enamine intermediates, YjgF/YER057c/UK114 family [Paenibacillus sp. cl123]SFW67766.1 Enamine deaminase RidA, house cleaning of reactive enamine intermediates, YjgF/YER057c/UK114 family [Paenibacillus sp. UNCCL117]
MAVIEKRLEELGIVLPPSPEPRFTYIPANRTGNLLYLSGQDARDANGVLIYEGKVGSDLTIEQGQEAARQVIINCLAVLKGYLGDLDRVVKIVKLLGFVNSAPGFGDQPYVMNGASNLLVDVFGENGRHARSAIGTSDLPFHTPVEIEIIVEIRD